MKSHGNVTIRSSMQKLNKRMRVYLDVPTKDFEYVKMLGAHWDDNHGHWYVAADNKNPILGKYITASAQVPKPDERLNKQVLNDPERIKSAPDTGPYTCSVCGQRNQTSRCFPRCEKQKRPGKHRSYRSIGDQTYAKIRNEAPEQSERGAGKASRPESNG